MPQTDDLKGLEGQSDTDLPPSYATSNQASPPPPSQSFLSKYSVALATLDDAMYERELPTGPVPKHLSQQQKTELLLGCIASFVFAVLAFVFAFDTYPHLKEDHRFQHDPNMLLILIGSVSAANCLDTFYRLYADMGDNCAPWWLQTLSGVVGLAIFCVWVWSIVVLDSSDAENLSDDYIKVYNFFMAFACIVGITCGCACFYAVDTQMNKGGINCD